MAITNRNLPVGTVLSGSYKKKALTCRVVAQDGEIRFQLDDRPEMFKSLSSAATAAQNGINANGWKFWTVKDGEAALPAEAPAAPAATPKKADAPRAPRVLKIITRTPNQKGVPEGSTRFYCSDCTKGFLAEGTATPEQCPNGHPPTAVDEPFETA